MTRRLPWTLVAIRLSLLLLPTGSLVAQALTPQEVTGLDVWYRRVSGRTAGDWGIAIGTMDGRVLWSVSPDQELIPASTTKLFTTGYSRARMGGAGRFSTSVVGDGELDRTSGRWLGTWA